MSEAGDFFMGAVAAGLAEQARKRWAGIDRPGFADFLNSLLLNKGATVATQIKWTVNAIQEAMRAAGSHWWDPDTMRTFGTKVYPNVWQGPGGVFFVTRDRQFDGSPNYTVRKFDPERLEIARQGELCEYDSRHDAEAAAARLAFGDQRDGVTVNTEEHKPISVLAQFIADLERHGGKGPVSSDTASALINRAGTHHRRMEDLCNGTLRTDREGESPVVNRLRDRIRELAAEVGAASVVFSGDPRGCTVKLTFPDGFTNDFGREGYCVPTSLRGD